MKKKKNYVFEMASPIQILFIEWSESFCNHFYMKYVIITIFIGKWMRIMLCTYGMLLKKNYDDKWREWWCLFMWLHLPATTN